MFKWLRKSKKEEEPLSRNGKSNAIAFQNVLKDPNFYRVWPGQVIYATDLTEEASAGFWSHFICGQRNYCAPDCKQFHPTFKPRTKEEYQADKAEEEKNQAEFLDTLVEAHDKVYTGWEAAFTRDRGSSAARGKEIMSDRIKKPLSLPAVPPTKIAQGQQATGERGEYVRGYKDAVGHAANIYEDIQDYRPSDIAAEIRSLADDVAAQQPTDGALRLSSQEFGVVEASVRERMKDLVDWNFTTIVRCTAEETLRALAAQASSDPLDKPRRD